MATPTADATISQAQAQAELAEELRQAEEEFARGDYIDVTVDELDRCLAAGVWPWERASSG